MNPKPVFTGIAAALVTFFDEHGHVDNEATAKHAAHLATRGVRAVVVAGSTGEASHLAMKERLQLLKAVKAAVPAHVPVILGTGDLAPGVSVPQLTRRAAEAGADAALVLSPRHGDVREFYGEVVGAAGSMPIIAYHWPKVSPPGITMEELKALKVAAIKDSTGDTERMLEMMACFHKPIYAGNSSVVAYAGMLGLTGAILAAANIEPELCADAFAGQVAAQKDLLFAHRIVSHYGVKGIKEELARKFGTSTVCRDCN
jgi:dihydrodipicolinate synthase/N-acetylneuraminate lyase